jgi:hypothetical protein
MMQHEAEEIRMRNIWCAVLAAGLMAIGVSGTNAAPGSAIGGHAQLAVAQPQLVQAIDMRRRRHCSWRNHRRHCWWR